MKSYIVKVEVVDDLDAPPAILYIEVKANSPYEALRQVDGTIAADVSQEAVGVYEKVRRT